MRYISRAFVVAFSLVGGLAFAQSEMASIKGGDSPLNSARANISTAENVRVQMVRNAATSAAMRAGLAQQTLVINRLIDERSRELDQIYDFSSLLIDGMILPPVIRRVERITEQEGDVLSYSAVRFRIVKQAKMVTRAPTWREFLRIPIFDNNNAVHPSLLPKSSDEKAAAAEGLKTGWEAGAKQANEMFFRGQQRLLNEFLGVMTYHALLKSNMVTLPKIARKNIPVSGDGSSMTIDQSVYSIQSRPSFNPQMMSWLALIEDASYSDLFKPDISAAEREKMNAGPSSVDDMRRMWNLN